MSGPPDGVSGPPDGVSGPPDGVSGPPDGMSGPPDGMSGPPDGVSGPPDGGPGPPDERSPDEPPPGSEPPAPGRLTRLDPDAAARSEGAAMPPPDPVVPPPPAVIDTRRYRWAIGIIGIALVIAISIYQFASHGVGTTGVPVGQHLRSFAAPLAASDLNGDPNLRPPCTLAHHDPRALNLCLDVRRSAVVLAFFVPGSSDCERQVDALQTLSQRFPASAVRFEAVAVHASHRTAAQLVRAHRWTIPVAYDRDGSVGSLYGLAICPMAELASRGGVVRDRLIGDRWETSAALYPRVRALVDGRGGGGRAS